VANLHKREQELLDAVAAEKKKAVMATSQAEFVNEQLQQRDEKIKHAQELLTAHQKQAKDHLEAQLSESRKALESELKLAQKTIVELQDELSRLQAERLRAKQNLVTVRETEGADSRQVPAESKASRKKSTTSIFGKVDFDEERPLGEQLKEALSKQAIRVLDLFRDWDTNGDGQITNKEFRKAMPALGMDLPVEVIDGLFDQYDSDKQGSIEFKELKKMLSGTSAPKKAPETSKRLSSAVEKGKPGKKFAAAVDAAQAASKGQAPAAATKGQ